jgi:acyl-CoA dehydrogenase
MPAFLSHLAKNRTAEHAAEVTRLGMEIFGGQGFMEEFPLARLHREALVTAIWEGASNIQALDLLEAMAKKGAHEPFLDEFIPLLERTGTPEARQAASVLEASIAELAGEDPQKAQWLSKESLRQLADAAQVGLLYALAEGSGGERYARLAVLYAHRFLAHEPYPSWALADQEIWFPFPGMVTS